jgi:hypothetical protein
MILKIAHALSFGNLGVRAHTATFWLAKNVTNRLLFKQEAKAHFEAVSCLSVCLSLVNLATLANKNRSLLIDDVK